MAPQVLYWAGVHTSELRNAETVRHNRSFSERGTAPPAPLVLRGLKYIDSTGVALLLRRQRQLQARGTNLALLNPGPAVQKALKVMRVDHLFEMRDEAA